MKRFLERTYRMSRALADSQKKNISLSERAKDRTSFLLFFYSIKIQGCIKSAHFMCLEHIAITHDSS